MASTQVTLAGGVTSLVPLDAPTGRVVITILSAAAAVSVTADGSAPVLNVNQAEVPGGQIVIAGVNGAQGVIQPPLFGDHMAVPTIRLLSAGAPVVLVSW